MKLLNFIHDGIIHLGASIDGLVIDLYQAYTAYKKQRQSSDSEVKVFPTDIPSLLEHDDETWQACKEIIDWVTMRGDDSMGEPFVYSLSRVKIMPPILNPSKIVCVGLNYADHCLEQNFEIPNSPVLFAKFPSALIGHEEPITWEPDSTRKVDYEAELAVIIRQRARNVSVEDAYSIVAGYTIANDVSARDVQFADKQWVRGKSFDTFCPLGPYLVTTDEVKDPHDLAIRCWINGELRQNSSTDQLIFKIPELLAFITKNCTLMPGDILLTGTPGGVGVFRDPPVFLKPGDVVEIEIQKLGRLRNPVG